jgi:hypothetical protein
LFEDVEDRPGHQAQVLWRVQGGEMMNTCPCCWSKNLSVLRQAGSVPVYVCKDCGAIIDPDNTRPKCGKAYFEVIESEPSEGGVSTTSLFVHSKTLTQGGMYLLSGCLADNKDMAFVTAADRLKAVRT